MFAAAMMPSGALLTVSSDHVTGRPRPSHPTPWLEALRKLNPFLAQSIEYSSSRRDVQEVRAIALCILLNHKDHEHPFKRTPDDVDGSIRHLHAVDMLRTWREWYCTTPPSVRCLRTHLSALERLGVLVRSPGVVPSFMRRLESPNIADAIHVVLSQREVTWWRVVGAGRLAAHAEARTDPGAWKQLFGSWRAEAADEGGGPGQLTRRTP